MTLQQLLEAIAGGVILLPFVQAFVAMLKSVVKDRLQNEYWPAVSMAVGILIAEIFTGFTSGQYAQAALVGAIAGLSASGLYDYAAGRQRAKSPPRG